MMKKIPLQVAYEIIIRQSFRDILELARVPPTLVAYRYIAVHANAAIHVMPAYFRRLDILRIADAFFVCSICMRK